MNTSVPCADSKSYKKFLVTRENVVFLFVKRLYGTFECRRTTLKLALKILAADDGFFATL